VEARVAVVEADEEFIGRFFADALDLGGGSQGTTGGSDERLAIGTRDRVEGREVDLFAGGQVDGIEAPILVAAGVLQVEDVAVGEGPEI
jgi:hypothetical protein